MKRTTAMILTLLSILLCGCPGLAACAISVYALTLNPQSLLIALQNYGIDPNSVGDPTVGLWAARLIWGLVALVLIAIPIIIGMITFRRAKAAAAKQSAVAYRPAPVPPARAPVQAQPAVVSRPAPVPPAYQPPAPARQAEPVFPVYQPPAPAPAAEPEPPAPVYEPPAPEPEPLPPAPVYQPPAPAPEPEPLPPVYQPPAATPQPEPLPPVDEPPAPAPVSEPLPPIQEEIPDVEAPAAPPEEQPEQAAPPMLDGATRLASNWSLVFVSGPTPVSTVVLGKKITFGRSADNDVTILDPLVSRQHATVELSGGGYLVIDLHSANGSFVNDVPLIDPVRLRVGDLVKFGGTVFRFQPFYEMP